MCWLEGKPPAANGGGAWGGLAGVDIDILWLNCDLEELLE